MTTQQYVQKYSNDHIIWTITLFIGKGYNLSDIYDSGDLDGLSDEEKDIIYELYCEAEESRPDFRKKYDQYKMYISY